MKENYVYIHTYANIYFNCRFTIVPETSMKLDKDFMFERIRITFEELDQNFGWGLVEILVGYVEFKNNENLVACMILFHLVLF